MVCACSILWKDIGKGKAREPDWNHMLENLSLHGKHVRAKETQKYFEQSVT